MSKLIVDDIELASGDLLSLPPSLPNNELISVSNNKLSAGGAVPAANHYLVHDFAGSQPTTISHTFINDSSKLAAIRIMFSNLVVTASTASTDVSYALGGANLDTTQTNPNGITGYNFRYCSVGVQNNSGSMQGTNGGLNSNQRMLAMCSRYNSNFYLNKSDTRDFLENHTHYILFDKNDNNEYVYRMMGESIKGHSSAAETSQVRYSSHWNSSVLSSSSDIPSSPTPYTKIEFNIPSNITFYAGKISIMEYAR